MFDNWTKNTKVEARLFDVEVRYATGVTKHFRHHTAKAARHEAKRLAGAAAVTSIQLIDFATGKRDTLWAAA